MQCTVTAYPHLRHLVTGVVLYVVLAGLVASNPESALGFWPGVLAGGLACVVWHACRRTQPSLAQARRRLRIAGVFCALGVVFALIPQRDIPIGAPFGALVALTIALAVDRRRAA